MLRTSSLFQFKHGAHACVFYNSEQSLTEVLTPYISDGLRNGERCFCVQKTSVKQRLLYDLRYLGFDPDKEMARGALEIHTENEIYFPNRVFEPEKMVEMLSRSIEDSVKRGFSAFRTAGELSWAVEGRDDCDQLIEYEKMVEKAYPGRPAIGICQYCTSAFHPEMLQRVLTVHREQIFDTQPNGAHSSMHLAFPDHTAEIVANRKMMSPKYYYVVRNRRSEEPVGWGLASDFDSASAKVQALARPA